MQATAFVAGPEAQAAVLKDMARQIGFKSVYSYRGVRDIEREVRATPLAFVLFTAVSQLTALEANVVEIRRSADDRVRMAPLICFADNPSLETIKSCIWMGFDDIITLPFSLKRVADRLSRQIDRPIVYYETDTYFGPDRRGRLQGDDEHPDRGKGGAHRRLDVIRTTASGAAILNDDAQVMI